MYQPAHFRQDDREAIRALVARNPLGSLVIDLDGRLEGTHVPCLFDPDHPEGGALRFHLARANPTATALDGSREALVMFTGPQAYISPDWYTSRDQVPTWNYVAVHVYGTPRPLDDAELGRLLDDLTREHETPLPKPPWSTAKLPPDRYARMRRAIVGLLMPIREIQAKWKLSQNRTESDRAGAAAGLRARHTETSGAVADLMQEE
jgi:transcriptional regulator